MHEFEQKILNFVRVNGPILPVQVAKNINKDITYAGAILSSLAASKHIRVTNVKMGGSPFYYINGQEHKLQDLVKYLKDREREICVSLKEKRVLREYDLPPVYRVAIKEAKDFAMPIVAKDNGATEVFWRWFLVDDEEAKKLIGQMFNKQEVKNEEIRPTEEQELPKEQELLEKQEEIIKTEPVTKPVKIGNGNFYSIVDDYIKGNNIKVLEFNTIRKNKEFNIIVKLPTIIGELTFFVKAKDKKKISNADLVLAYNEGREKHLPVLLLTNGTTGKKAQQFIEKNLKGQLIFKNIN